MQVLCKNCKHMWTMTSEATEICRHCNKLNSFKPLSDKPGQKYLVRVSELRYGEVTVWADSEEAAKTIASGAEITFFDSEITDMTAEPVKKGEQKWVR